tara:strand:+ start:572 stop:751 length:180 start_codon:yes stop_codon:yes gene_type:complete
MKNEDVFVKKEKYIGLNLDQFSIDDLQKYLVELKDEIDRVKSTIIKKNIAKNKASKFFK